MGSVATPARDVGSHPATPTTSVRASAKGRLAIAAQRALSPRSNEGALGGHDLGEVLTHPDRIRQALERAQEGQWVPQELQARREQVRQGRLQLEQQRERLTDAYQSGVLPLAEYQRRRQAVEQQMGVLDRQAQQIASQVEQQQELAGVMVSIEAFCQRVQAGLENATFAQKRQLVELLIDRVIVTNGDVEIHYVIPTSPSSEYVRFSHLRTNYLHRLPGWKIAWQVAPGTPRV